MNKVVLWLRRCPPPLPPFPPLSPPLPPSPPQLSISHHVVRHPDSGPCQRQGWQVARCLSGCSARTDRQPVKGSLCGQSSDEERQQRRGRRTVGQGEISWTSRRPLPRCAHAHLLQKNSCSNSSFSLYKNTLL